VPLPPNSSSKKSARAEIVIVRLATQEVTYLGSRKFNRQKA
jgi:hypothetical protein